MRKHKTSSEHKICVHIDPEMLQRTSETEEHGPSRFEDTVVVGKSFSRIRRLHVRITSGKPSVSKCES